MNYLEKHNLTTNNDFLARVKVASLKAAGDLLADPAQPVKVRQYAQEVINNPDGGWFRAMVFQVISVGADASDDDIQASVNSNFEKLAKAKAGDLG